MNYSEQILKARFEQLPESVKEAIIAMRWKDKLAKIADRYRLRIDQADRLNKETIVVMFGFEHLDNLAYNIAQNVEVSEEKAESIAKDLDREIFLKVKESLKRIFEGENKEKIGGDKNLLIDRSLEKKEEKEETLSREDVLREIEDKEHHNLPTMNRTELHLEVGLPSEIGEKIANLPTEQISVKKTGDAVQPSAQDKIIPLSTKQTRNPLSLEKMEAVKTMPRDIIKAKMGETVRLPKKTVEIRDSASPPKVEKQGVSKKTDPYRESVG